MEGGKGEVVRKIGPGTAVQHLLKDKAKARVRVRLLGWYILL